MLRILREIPVLVAFLAVVNIFTGAPMAVANSPVPQTLEELDLAIEAAVKTDAIPGMGVAVIENNSVVFAKGYGLSDVARKAPVTTDTLFRVGSVSKSFIGIAAMILVEEGKLSLDTPLVQLAPDVPTVNPLEKDQPVRLVHLLEHTSGWPDYTIHQFGIDGRNMALSDAVLKGAPYTSSYAPGQYFLYSNPGAAAAALMVERAAGIAYEDFVRARIFGALAMSSATFDRPPNGLATSYLRDGKTSAGYMHLSARAIGGLNATARDMAQLPLLMLGRGTLNGETLLRPESVDRIERVVTTRAAGLGLAHGYGLANLSMFADKVVFRGHDGAIDGAQSVVAYLPSHGSGYVVLWTKQVDAEAVDLIQSYLTRNIDKPIVASGSVTHDGLAVHEGYYQSIALREPLIAPLATLFSYTTVRASGETLVIQDNAFEAFIGRILEPIIGATATAAEPLYHQVAEGRFQRADRSVPTVQFVQDDKQHLLLMPLHTLQKIDVQAVQQRAAWGVAFVLVFVFAVLHVPLWLWLGLRGRLRSRGGIGLRLLPLLAVGSVLGLTGFAFYVLNMESPVLFHSLGQKTPLSMSLFVATLMVPIFGFLSFWRGLTAGYGAPGWIRIYAMVAGGLVLIAAAYLNDYGWIGLMTWAK